MKYLITDPCYIVPDNEWSDFCDTQIDGVQAGGYKVEGLGTIVECDGTEWGDGHAKVGNGKEVLVDSGTVCLVELDEGVTPTEYQGNAVTARADTARNWYEIAKRI